MAVSSPRDANRVPSLTATSSVDGVSAVLVYADPTTNRLLVQIGTSFADAEIPTGAINGSNVTFTLTNTPSPAKSLLFTVNGQVLYPVGIDYTLSNATVTVNTAPPIGSTIEAWYRY